MAAELREEGQRADLQDALRALKADYDTRRARRRPAIGSPRSLRKHAPSPRERHWARSLARFGEGTPALDRALAAALALLSTQRAALDLNKQRAQSESALIFLVAQELDYE